MRAEARQPRMPAESLPFPQEVHRNTRFATVADSHCPLALENGGFLQPVQVAYETWGKLNADGGNALLICHALTGNAHAADVTPDGRGLDPAADGPAGWWNALIGPGRVFDTCRYFVVASNILGGCYGSSGPASIDPQTGRRYGPAFPQITVRDMVRVQQRLLRQLGVRRLAAVAGGSLGGMQVLEWGLLFPDMVERLIPIATTAAHSAWAIALNETARQAIMGDPQWAGGDYNEQPQHGLALARMMAMISYRSFYSYQTRFGRNPPGPDNRQTALFGDPPGYEVESYLRYQGEKLVRRFDANTYVHLSRAMDLHDVRRGRSGALQSIAAKTLCIGIDSDLLYPPEQQREIAREIPGARYAEITSRHGHDAFLIENEQLAAQIKPFLYF